MSVTAQAGKGHRSLPKQALHIFSRDFKKINTKFKGKALDMAFAMFEIGIYLFELAPKKVLVLHHQHQ